MVPFFYLHHQPLVVYYTLDTTRRPFQAARITEERSCSLLMLEIPSEAENHLRSICPDMSRTKPASTCCSTLPNSPQTQSVSWFRIVCLFFLVLMLIDEGLISGPTEASEPFFPLLKEAENRKIVLNCLCNLQRTITACTRQPASCL